MRSGFAGSPWLGLLGFIGFVLLLATALALLSRILPLWPRMRRNGLPVVLVAICADGFARATLDSLHAKHELLRCLRLLRYVGNAVLGVAGKVGWRDLAAEVAVKARPVHVELASDVHCEPVLKGSHVFVVFVCVRSVA
jgi:hypothetical protein